MQTDLLIQARKLVMIIKKRQKKRELTVEGNLLSQQTKEWKSKKTYFELARELRNLWNMKLTVMQIVIGPQSVGKKLGRVGNWKNNREHANCRIIENTQNTEKSPGDMKRLVVTQTIVKEHQLTLVWKTRKKQHKKAKNFNEYDVALYQKSNKSEYII